MDSSVSAATVAANLDFAEKVVMPQGMIFIRELLRQKQRDRPEVRIGFAKEEVKENLRAAIRAGAVTFEDLEAFLGEVEGWGNQHIYLYDASRVTGLPLWKSEAALRREAVEAGYGAAWESSGDPTFPDELALEGLSYRNGCFEFVWREKDEAWHRDDTRDKPPEVIDGDRYEFRAYRQELKRSVMRFVLVPATGKAGLFVQIPLGGRHARALETAREALARLFPYDQLRAADVSTAIKVLDTRDLNWDAKDPHGRMQAQNTKFESEGATVEFDADTRIGTWKSVPEVRRVRRALKTDAFRGYKGKFVVSLRLGPGMGRDVVLALNGKAGRIYLQAQMTAQEVWTVLDQVLEAGAGSL
jgi:hypothetical protein